MRNGSNSAGMPYASPQPALGDAMLAHGLARMASIKAWFEKPESTRYRGKHWIECYIVKDDVLLASDHRTVLIM